MTRMKRGDRATQHAANVSTLIRWYPVRTSALNGKHYPSYTAL